MNNLITKFKRNFLKFYIPVLICLLHDNRKKRFYLSSHFVVNYVNILPPVSYEETIKVVSYNLINIFASNYFFRVKK